MVEGVRSEEAGTGPYRGRLAPSPTGLVHLGHAWTFAVAAGRARHASGRLVLRMEDLDPQRSREVYARAAVEDLQWLGLDWDEGPDVGGPYAPYAQRERGELYLTAWRRLVESGWVYPCSCSRKDLLERTGAPHEGGRGGPEGAGEESIYSGTCRPAVQASAVAPAGPAGVNWRFRVPAGERVGFVDGGFGPCEYTGGVDFGDFLVWRRDDVPAYQLAVVVDDAAMRVTEVVRGADLLLSTARQLLLYRALELRAPGWFHCALVLDGEGRRMAKRSQAGAIRTLREAGRSREEVLRMAAEGVGSLHRG